MLVMKKALKKKILRGHLGLIVGTDLEWRKCVDRMIGKANKALGVLMRTFESKMWKDLYVPLVRPHLEYAMQAWNPHLQE